MQGYPFDHAGHGETSLMMDLYPQAVDAARIADGPWYTQTAKAASAELGARGVELILEQLREVVR